MPASGEQQNLLAWLGRKLIEFLRFLGEMVILNTRVLGGIAKRRTEYRTTVAQMAHVGVNSLPIVAVTMLFTGMVLAYHASIQANKLGAANLVGWLVAETMCRELGPVLTSIVISARVGSAMTAELGTMKVTEQIDALRALAVNPVDYLVVPRYVACFVMVPILVLIGDSIGVMGGWVLATVTSDINPVAYLANLPGNLALWTVIAGIIKSMVFAIIVAVVSCYEGLNCQMASAEVGKATTRSVVYCIMLIYTANVLLTMLLFPG